MGQSEYVVAGAGGVYDLRVPARVLPLQGGQKVLHEMPREGDGARGGGIGVEKVWICQEWANVKFLEEVGEWGFRFWRIVYAGVVPPAPGDWVMAKPSQVFNCDNNLCSKQHWTDWDSHKIKEE